MKRGEVVKRKGISLVLMALILFSLSFSASAAGYEVVTEPRYNMAYSFDAEVTRVSENGKWALADTTGYPITEFKWDALGDTTASLIPAKSGEKWGYISSKGKVVIPYSYTYAGSFNDGIAMVQNEKREHLYIDAEGNILFSSPFNDSFSPREGAICGVIDDSYGYCDTSGTIFISPAYDMAYDFHNGLAAVRLDGKWGYITTYGEIAVKPIYDFASDFYNGYAVCRLSGKYGIIDNTVKKVSPFTFDYIGVPDESGRYPAKSGEISGYVDESGKWILKTDYDYCYKFTDGVGRVFKDGLWGYINESGEEIVPPIFVDCGEYKNGLAPYSTDGVLWGYLKLDLTSPVPQAPVKPETPGLDENQEVVYSEEDLPLLPVSEKCISMQIGKGFAVKDSKVIKLSGSPLLVDGSTMIPVRSVVELLGGSIAWNGETRRIYITHENKNIIMEIDSKIIFLDGVPTAANQAPLLIEGNTMVPLRAVVDCLGCKIEWINTEQNIYIYY